jgi:hypothetical protein
MGSAYNSSHDTCAAYQKSFPPHFKNLVEVGEEVRGNRLRIQSIAAQAQHNVSKQRIAEKYVSERAVVAVHVSHHKVERVPASGEDVNQHATKNAGNVTGLHSAMSFSS